MSTNNIKKRIFAIACRKGVAVLTDSKPNANGNGTVKQFTAENSQLASLKAFNDLLGRMPVGVKFDYTISVLLPETISYLSYEDTRNYWIANGKKKSGEVVEPNMLEEVKKLHKLLRIHSGNLQIFNQSKITSPVYKAYARATWSALDKYVPVEKQDTVSCNDF